MNGKGKTPVKAPFVHLLTDEKLLSVNTLVEKIWDMSMICQYVGQML